MSPINKQQHLGVMKQISELLQDVKDSDPAQHDIIIDFLSLVFKEYNSGKKLNIDKRLYDMIDAEVLRTLKTMD